LLRKTLIALAATVALCCVPVATNAFAAGHSAGHASVGHATGARAMAGAARHGHAAGFARSGRVAGYGRGYGPRTDNGPIYDSCAGYGYGYGYGPGYGYNGCPGYGAPLVGGVIDGILGGYGPY
jgi:hypothetical protein